MTRTAWLILRGPINSPEDWPVAWSESEGAAVEFAAKLQVEERSKTYPDRITVAPVPHILDLLEKQAGVADT